MQLILPFIEEGNLYNKIRMDLPLSDPINLAIAQTVVQAFLCPSDGGTDRPMGDREVWEIAAPTGWPGTFAVNNYKASLGANWGWGTFVVATPSGRYSRNADGLDHGNGFVTRGYHLKTTTKIADVQDGTSKTFALGEAVPLWCSHTWWWHFNGVSATCAVPLNFKPPGHSTLNAWDDPVRRRDWPHNYSFMSQHPGGAHFANVDGSVRYISDTIPTNVYRALSTIRSGEAVSEQ